MGTPGMEGRNQVPPWLSVLREAEALGFAEGQGWLCSATQTRSPILTDHMVLHAPSGHSVHCADFPVSQAAQVQQWPPRKGLGPVRLGRLTPTPTSHPGTQEPTGLLSGTVVGDVGPTLLKAFAFPCVESSRISPEDWGAGESHTEKLWQLGCRPSTRSPVPQT